MLQSTFDRSQSKRQLTGLRCLINEEDIRFLVNSIILLVWLRYGYWCGEGVRISTDLEMG